ncbi:hypothetical protein FPV67DRAFT_1110108 [Lyophyllum atratum]|nr:hypothetical protein FPV67DRAFT_1110108 [Lyophyllum atratum]
MIIAGDTRNHSFLSKFSLQTFLPFPSLIPTFTNEHHLWHQQSLETDLTDHVASIQSHAIQPPPSINRLPIELLADIFSLTLRNYAGDWGMHGPPLSRNFPGLSFSPGSSSDPMMLAQVCRHWRDVALSTPMLWSSMAIACTDRRRHIPLLEIWLQRSRTCPLTISLLEPFWETKDKNQWWPQQCALATDILSLLITQSHRWKSINFRFSLRIPFVLENLHPESFQILESAMVSSCQVATSFSDGLPSLDKVWGAVHSSPSFHEGQWDYEYLEHRRENIPWVQLTCIDVTMSVDSLFEVLPFCHNLVDLRFTDPRLICNSSNLPSLIPAYRTYPQTTIVLPSLRNLAMAMKQPSDPIFRRLTLPSLSSFNIQQSRTWQGRPDAASFNDLLARSQCYLKRCSYEDSSPDGEDFLLQMLASPYMASLVTLSVDCPVTDKFAKFLTYTPGLNPLTLPRLEELFIGVCTSSPGALVDMVFCRRLKVAGHSLLRDVQLGSWDCHEVDLEGFQVLAGQGMFVYV